MITTMMSVLIVLKLIFLKTPLGPEKQARRLLRMAKDAHTAEEEQGLNILFLALGFLRWKESTSSQIVREAPLILLPVEFVRHDKTSTYHLKVRKIPCSGSF